MNCKDKIVDIFNQFFYAKHVFILSLFFFLVSICRVPLFSTIKSLEIFLHMILVFTWECFHLLFLLFFSSIKW